MRAAFRLLAGAALVFPAACDSSSPTDLGPESDGIGTGLFTNGVELYTYRVRGQYPHDAGAFTQGLVVHDHELFEGTGLRGASSIRRVDLVTGTVLQQHDLEAPLFGEGITVFQDRLVQLTWTSRIGFVYDRNTFAEEDEFSYATEGWGLTHDGSRMIMSDGTPRLRFLDPESFEVLSEVVVRDDGVPIMNLNELEYVEDYVLANVWQTDRIAIIDPDTGEVVSWLDLGGLLTTNERASADVLNGIAFDQEAARLLVTGKLWPYLFEIEPVPVTSR